MLRPFSPWLILTAILALPTFPASAQAPDYGVIPKADFEKARLVAKDEAKTKFDTAGRLARENRFNEAKIARANQPAMHLHGTIESVLENGVRIRMRWDRFGYAENPLANLKKVDASLFQTNKGGSRADWTVFPGEVKALALEMDDKLALWGDAIEGRFVRGAKMGVGVPEVIGYTQKASAKTRARFKKGDIIDPSTFTDKDMNRVAKAMVKGYLRKGGRPGPGFDVLAGDMNIKFPQLAEMARTFSKVLRKQAKTLKKRLTIGVSGLAHKEGDPSGGIEFRKVSTGYGVWVAAKLEAKHSGMKLAGATVATEGYGEVGRGFVEAALADGARVIAISKTAKMGGERTPGVFFHPAALRGANERASALKSRIATVDVNDSRAWVKAVEAFHASRQNLEDYQGKVSYRDAKGVKREVLLRKCFSAKAHISEVDFVDIVGVNARGGSLNPKTLRELVKRPTLQGIKKIVSEGANLAATLEGAKLISERYSDAKPRKGENVVTFLHGVFANGGGVFTSDLQIVQNLYDEMVSSPKARQALETVMERIYAETVKLRREKKISTREAISLLANKRRMKRALNLPGAPHNNLEELVISAKRRKARPNAVKKYAAAVLAEYGLGREMGQRRGKGKGRANKVARERSFLRGLSSSLSRQVSRAQLRAKMPRLNPRKQTKRLPYAPRRAPLRRR